MNGLERAIQVAGSQAKLAEALGVTQQAVSKWLTSKGRIPAELVPRASQATGLQPHELRDDIFPAPPAPQPAPEAASA